MGQFLMLFSITLLPPVLIDILYREDAALAFFYSYLILLTAGFLLYLPVRNHGDPNGDLAFRAPGAMALINPNSRVKMVKSRSDSPKG